jgi:hypothetical protein
MPNMPFAFGFGARDEGMSSAMSSALSSLDKINKSMDTGNKIAKRSVVGAMFKGMAGATVGLAKGAAGVAANMAGAFGRAASNRIQQFNMAGIATNVRNLVADTGELTLGMESAAASFAQAAKPTLSKMGVMGKELQRMTGQAAGMAYGMNVDVGTVTNTMLALRNSGESAKSVLKEIGMSTQSFVKLATVTGVSTENLGAMGGVMVAQFGMSAEKAKSLIEYTVAMGQKANVGTLMFEGMNEQLNSIRDTLAKNNSLNAYSADQIQQMVEGSVKLSGAYRTMGLNAEDAAAAARQTSNTFLDWATQAQNALNGTGEMPPIFEQLSALGIGADQAMEIIRTGAVDATQGMMKLSKVMQEAKASGTPIDAFALQAVQESLAGASGAAVFMSLSTEKGTQALQDMSAASVNAAGALNKLEKGFSSGRTLQESLDMAKEAFRMRVRSVTRPEVVGLVHEQISAYKTLGTQVKELGSDATWGPLVKGLSIFDQMGAKGVIMHFGKQMGGNTKEMAKMGVVMDVALGTIEKVRAEMGPLMETLQAFGPVGMAAGGIFAWFMMDETTRQKIVDTIMPMWNMIKPGIIKMWDDFTAKVKDVWSNQIIPFFEKNGGDIGQFVVDGFNAIPWDKILSGVSWVFDKLALMVGGAIAKAFPKLAEFTGITAGLEKAQVEYDKGRAAAAAASQEKSRAREQAQYLKERPAQLENQLIRQQAAGRGIKNLSDADVQQIKDTMPAAELAKLKGAAFQGTQQESMALAGAEKKRQYLKQNAVTQNPEMQAAIEKATKYAQSIKKLGGTDEKAQQVFDLVGQAEGLRMGAEKERADRGFWLGSAVETKLQYDAQGKYAEIDDIIKKLKGQERGTGWDKRGGVVDPNAPTGGPQGSGTPQKPYVFEDAQKMLGGLATVQAQIQSTTASAAGAAAETTLKLGNALTDPAMFDSANTSGKTVMEMMAGGIKDASGDVFSAVSNTLQTGVKDPLPNSPPISGPIAGSFLENAGSKILELILKGISDKQWDFQSGFAQILEESTTFAVEAFRAKALAEMQKNTITMDLLGDITKGYGGLLTEDDKKVLKQSLDMSGLYGVINAIVLDGAQTRVLLSAIETNTRPPGAAAPGNVKPVSKQTDVTK